MNGKIKRSSEAAHFKASELTITAASNLWHIDGEAVLIDSPVHIKVLPLTLHILSK